MMKVVSIIIPMYNVAQYLEKCVQSVVDQNFEENTFEIIMIDDESPDNSREVAEAMAARMPFIKVISQKNKGLGGARNTGIQNSQGKYVLFLDADDWFIPNTVQELIDIAEKENLDILEYGANLVWENGELKGTLSKSTDGEVYDGITYYNHLKYSGSACNKLYRTAFLKTNSLYFLEKIYGEDFEFNTRSFFHAKRVMAVKNVCSEFLQSMNSITRNSDKSKKDKYLDDFKKILKSIDGYKRRNSLENAEQSCNDFFDERLTMVNINAFYMMFKNNYSYSEMKVYRDYLKQHKLLHFKNPVAIKKKNLFRKIMLNNFALFSLTQPLKKMIKA